MVGDIRFAVSRVPAKQHEDAMVSDPTPALQGSADSRASGAGRTDPLEALIADLTSQHALFLTVPEEAVSASAQARRHSATSHGSSTTG